MTQEPELIISENQNTNEREGFVKLYRSIKKHWLWQDAERLKWWIDILIEVNHRPKKVLINGTLYDCGRGESLNSLGTWAKSWRVGVGRVRGFFELLEKNSMIITKSVGKTTRLTVCNYERYNDKQQLDNNLATTSQQLDNNLTATNKNVKKGKNDKNGKNIEAVGVFFTDENLNEEWKRWLVYRKEIRKPITTTAAEKQVAFLQKFSAPVAVEIIAQSIRNQWQGLFELKNNSHGQNGKPTTEQRIAEYVNR